MAIDEKWSYSECQKMLMAYLAKNKITANMSLEQSIQTQRKYKEKYTVEQFIEKLREVYDIKGEITPDKIRKVRKKSDVPLEKDEHEIQKQVCKYLDKKGYKYFSVPNGFVFKSNKKNNANDNVSSAKYINYLKAEGLRVGIFDLVILLGNGEAAFLELKKPKGKATEHQLKWQEWFNNNGYKNKIAYGYDEAVDFIQRLANK